MYRYEKVLTNLLKVLGLPVFQACYITELCSSIFETVSLIVKKISLGLIMPFELRTRRHKYSYVVALKII